MKTLERLQSSNAVLAVLVLALLAQMPHAQHVFYDLSRDLGWFGWVQSWFGAIALEFAVLVFVVRGKRMESWGFAAFSVAINMVYYYDPGVALWVPRSTWLLSAGLPVAIALYSHEVAGKHTPTIPVVEVDQPTAAEDQPATAEVDQPVAVVDWPVNNINVAELASQLLADRGGDRALVAIELSKRGFKGVDIASALSVHKTQVSRWLKKGEK